MIWYDFHMKIKDLYFPQKADRSLLDIGKQQKKYKT